MKIKQKLFIVIGLIGFIYLFTGISVFAACGNTENTSIINCPSGGDAITYILKLIVKILTVLIGVAATGGIIYGSIMYTTSAGKAESTKKGREIITNTIIGLVAYALMYVVLNFIIPGGINW